MDHKLSDVLVKTAETQQRTDKAEELPFEQQDWNLDRGHRNPLHIKEEEEERWILQDEDQVQEVGKTDVTVKSEHEEKPQTSQIHHSQAESNSQKNLKTGSNEINCEGPEPASNFSYLQPDIDDKTLGSYKYVTEDNDSADSDFWKETRERQPGSHDKCNVGLGLGNVEKPFSCSKCGKIFSSRHHFRRHVSVTFMCPECGQRFGCKNSLKIHMTHTGEKPFSCTECGRKFSSERSVVIHTKIHTGEKPFSCTECGHKFISKRNLVIHRRIHTGEKPFSCAKCSKRFGVKCALIKHLRIHSDKPKGKPFICVLCDKEFKQVKNLRLHAKIHTGEKPFCCTVCQKKFTWKISLVRHHCGGKISH
ncbi:gastrula zinc finger protein XlCGF8.2DB-like [Thalassophryne amazonica]|uniref:gastrula zinc finger protein XlCGF8.2DB-like n=1 Tax=Thalassophryne amazonica TaxID=390379 RepID=UPI0014714291|nr:gastrula zinc finger protein XlCGF8.2DB-like [Thalassophryne amazonica]